MEPQRSQSVHNSIQSQKYKIMNTSAQPVIKMNNAKYINYTEEDYEKGLETLNLPMKMLLNTLEYNPKVLFVKLSLVGQNSSPNGKVYKTRNKSVVQFLSPSEIEQKAVQDVKLMCNTIKKMILASGKLITSGIQPVDTINAKANALVTCKTCKVTFSKRSDLVNHIANNHPDVPLQCCSFCDKKFLMLHGLTQHININHRIIKNENKRKSLGARSKSFPFKTYSGEEGSNKDNWMYVLSRNDSSKALPEVGISKKGKVKIESTRNYHSNDSFITDRNIDSDSLSSNPGRKTKFDIPVISSIQKRNKCGIEDEEMGNSSKIRVTVISTTNHHDVRKPVFNSESNDSDKSNRNLDFIFSSNNNLEPKILENRLVESSSLSQNISSVRRTSRQSKIPEFDIQKILVFPKNSENKSTTVEYFDVKTDASVNKNNTLLLNGCTSKETTSEPVNTVKDYVLPKLNSTQDEADHNSVIEFESQKRKSFSKFGEQEMMSSSNQTIEKMNTRVVPTVDEKFSEKLCCMCLDIINVTKQIFNKQQDSKFKCHDCPFCGLRYADIYFEHHIATFHLICNKKECKSRVILNGFMLRKILTMQIKTECIHVNCSHNSLMDLGESKDNLHSTKFKNDQTLNVADNLKDMTTFVINKNETKHQEYDTTGNKIENYRLDYFSEDLKTASKNTEDFEKEKEKVKLLHNKCSVSNTIPSINTKYYNNVNENYCFEEKERVSSTDSLCVDISSSNAEENEVSSSNDDEVLPQNSHSDESLEAVKVESSEPSIYCSVCEETFHQEQKLLAHLFNYHRFSHPFTCDICFLCYEHIKDLQAHVEVHGKQLVLATTKSNTSDIVKEFSLEKCSLSGTHSAIEYNVKKKPYLTESNEAQDIQCVESNFAIEYNVKKEPHLTESNEVQDIQSIESNVTKHFSNIESNVVDAGSSIKVNLPAELPFLKLNSTKEHCSLKSGISKVSTINCNPAVIKSESDYATSRFQKEQRNFPLKKKKLKISCVVEKVEYPLDIQNLYAHIRKAENPKVIHSTESEFESNSSAECINASLRSVETKKELSPVESNISLAKTTMRRKMSSSFSMPTKKIKEDHCLTHTDSVTDEVIFHCNICDRIFDFKRSYSEHMFFMHDAIFDDSVVCDLLKPSSRESKNIENTLQNTSYKKNSSTDAGFPQSTETRKTINGFEKQENSISKRKILQESNSEKQEKNLTDEVINNVRNCSQCGERYVQVASYFQHRYDKHGDDSLVHVCENCGKVSITVNMVNSHLCTQVDTFSCKDCGIKFVNGLALKEHNTKTHFESIGPHVCHDCKKCFLTNRMLQKHKRIIHSGIRSIISVKKEKSTSDESNGSRAKITDQVEKLERRFINENLPRKDQAVTSAKPSITKSKINSLTCPLCKFVLQTTRRLQAHLMVNHSKVTDICLLCNRLFAFGRGIRHILDFHIVPTYNENKVYELSWEGDPRKDVKEAMEVLGDKRLLAICNYDDYTTLTDSSSFQCRLCLMTYSAVRYYRNHYVQWHDEFCALCDQSFESNKDFTSHVEEVHSSLKHYLWFMETIISTIIKTERTKENPSETLMQIIGRKLDENEVNAASQLLEQMQDEKISTNSTFVEKSQPAAIAVCESPGSNSDLSESTIGLPLPDSQLTNETCEISISMSEPPTESRRADILELPDFCMEYEITDNGTVVTQNPNYCSNEVFFSSMNDEKEYTERGMERKMANNSTIPDRLFDMSRCIFENSVSINDNSAGNLKKNEMTTAMENCATDNQVFLGHTAKVISVEKGGECNSVAAGINNGSNNEKVALVVSEEDLRMYKNNIQALAERLSVTCNELSVDEIVETLQAYVISQR